MAEIVDMHGNPITRLHQQIAAKDAEIAELTKQLIETKSKLSSLVGVNEMLKIALRDLQGTLFLYRDQLAGMASNIGLLYQKLPDIDSRVTEKKSDE